VALPGDDYLPFVGDSDAIVGEIEEFLTGFREAHQPERLLATVVFTDIVGSTERVAAVGDRRWRELLDRHREVVRRVLARYRGREVDTTGDGVLATFDGPGRAIRAAEALRESVRDLGLTIRAGVHTGEIELAGEEIRGIAVHIGARVAALAGPGEVLVSSTVKDLVAGSDIGFDDVGIHSLKGVPGEWRLFRVTSRTVREDGGPSSDR
jgi:class 3 adenylate cyclase